ncbi:MAG: dienelactone hydrolase family protein [Rhodothermia bacterium]|nr:dienelactone hydrolase family protein [Rhodothermia bacterium]
MEPGEEADEASGPDVRGTEVNYTGGGATMNGYLTYDASVEGRRPGVLVVHEWWGHNDHARDRARMLAELGYTALAVDMYGDGRTADHPGDASALMQEVISDMDAAVARFNAALDVLRGHETTDPDKIAAIGYCFGGGVVLEMARRGMDLDGVVAFHGSIGPPDTPTEPGTVVADVLVIVGGDDPFVPAEQLGAFRADLEQAEADIEVVVYEGVRHSFTNPAADTVGSKFDLPLEYDAKADSASWQAMKDLFEDIFDDAGN